MFFFHSYAALPISCKVCSKYLRNQTRKIVAKAMRMEANQEWNDLYQNSNNVLYFLRRMKKKNLEERKCLRERDR